jgi:hypothetical protein
VAELRAYEAELDSRIKMEEDSAPERACLEKVLGLRRRFRVNKKKPPHEQYEKLHGTI